MSVLSEGHGSGSQAAGHSRSAAVIGASMAGLVTARVLNDHFDRVFLIEKDVVTNQPVSRKGQPQTRHLHGLLAKGLDIYEMLFPGLTEELIGHDAIYDDMGAVIRWYHFGGYRKQFRSELMGVVQSRPLLESLVRQRVLALRHVELMDQSPVDQFAVHNHRITGLFVRKKDDRALIECDLVVDCTGRGSRTPIWLQAHGFPVPPKSEVTVHVGYATRIYQRHEDDLHGARLLISFPRPPDEKRAGFLFPIEGNRWMLTAAGWHRDYPPADEAGLNAFVQSLPLPDISRIVHSAQPLTDIRTYRFKSSRRFHYEKLRTFPAGLLVLGDAVASFNPVYGQGMTSAALQAEVLSKCLRAGLAGKKLYRHYFRKVAQVLKTPWQLATGEDFRYPETSGSKSPGTDLLNAYVAHVHKATQVDTRVYAQFLKVMNMIQPPTSLMRPGMLWRVLRAGT